MLFLPSKAAPLPVVAMDQEEEEVGVEALLREGSKQ